ncbi:MAG TPA: hypothetical protein PLO63_10400 [Syntrophales bacterium]|jgi:hypothetical protein|nr:hypothetical protein [Syntrophales bacterium]
MDPLDMRTLIFVSGFTSLVLFFCMLYIWEHQQTYPGFLRWTFASLLNAAGMILISQRNIITDVLSIIVADVLLLAAMMLITSGLSLFATRNPRNRSYAATMALFLVFILCFTYLWPSYPLRVIVYSLVQASLCLLAAYILYRHLPAVIPGRDMTFSWFFIFCSVFPILRAVSTFMGPQEPAEVLSVGLINQVVILVGLEVYVIVDIGLIILNGQRINHELKTAREEIKTIAGFIPICASCKKIRDDEGSWNQLEAYLSQRIDVSFSHGLCPECAQKLYPDFYKKADG